MCIADGLKVLPVNDGLPTSFSPMWQYISRPFIVHVEMLPNRPIALVWRPPGKPSMMATWQSVHQLGRICSMRSTE